MTHPLADEARSLAREGRDWQRFGRPIPKRDAEDLIPALTRSLRRSADELDRLTDTINALADEFEHESGRPEITHMPENQRQAVARWLRSIAAGQPTTETIR